MGHTKPFKVAGGTGRSGTRTISTNWAYFDVQWLVKIKVDSEGKRSLRELEAAWGCADCPHQAQDPHGGGGAAYGGARRRTNSLRDARNRLPALRRRGKAK
eukprot:7379385-Prymnesium_polylepis.2